MKTQISIEQLLRWRVALAETEAPPPPRAARLLELARPWWERYPRRFQSFLERVGKMEIAYGHAMAESRPACTVHPVPALIVRSEEQIEACAQVLYLSLRDGQLRLRFQLKGGPEPADPGFEITFVSNMPARPLFSALATRSVDNEYRLDTELPPEIIEEWRHLRVTDRMPFRFILRPRADDT
jgi:hypothetical protein